MSEQLTSRIMHHFLWLSKHQMDIVIICVSQCEIQLYEGAALEFYFRNNDGKHFLIPGYECFVAHMFLCSIAQIFAIPCLPFIIELNI